MNTNAHLHIPGHTHTHSPSHTHTHMHPDTCSPSHTSTHIHVTKRTQKYSTYSYRYTLTHTSSHTITHSAHPHVHKHIHIHLHITTHKVFLQSLMSFATHRLCTITWRTLQKTHFLFHKAALFKTVLMPEKHNRASPAQFSDF